MRAPLPVSTNDHFIRLLNLDHVNGHSLTVNPLNDPPPYHALSYCWGDQKPSRKLVCDRQTILITPSLHVALEQMYRIGYKVLWVDQICIDQENIREKNHQVGLMGKIYSSADAALIWLGVSAADEATADHVRRWSTFCKENENVLLEPRLYGTLFKSPDLTALLQHGSQVSFIRLVSRPWFTRAWVVQEFALAQEASVILGETVLDWKELLRAFTALRNGARFDQLTASNWSSVHRCLGFARTRWSVLSNDRFDLFHIFNAHREQACQDQRDRIFSMLDILRKDSTFLMTPDYNAELEEVYFNFASALVTSTSKLDMLCFLRPSDIQRRHLPSWVPNFGPTRQRPLLHVSLTKEAKSPWTAASESEGSRRYRLDGRTLLLNGHRFDLLKAKSCHAPNISHILDGLEDESEEQGHNELAFLDGGMICQAVKSQSEICPSQDLLAQMMLFGHRLEDTTMVLKVLQLLARSKAWEAIRQLPPLVLHTLIKGLNLDSSLVMARTIRGHYCWVPWDTQLGDEIVLCAGSRVPLAIRRLNPGNDPPTYHMLGGCYVHGIMFGEAWRPDEVHEMRFV